MASSDSTAHYATTAFLESLTPLDAARYYTIRRATVPPEIVHALIRPLLPSTLSEDAQRSISAALSGAAKAFAVQLAEESRVIAGDAPRISESHVFEAHRRLVLRGLLPSPGGPRCSLYPVDDLLVTASGNQATKSPET